MANYIVGLIVEKAPWWASKSSPKRDNGKDCLKKTNLKGQGG